MKQEGAVVRRNRRATGMRAPMQYRAKLLSD